jgi:glycosyltransferase involved in cell wall biosynthesis
LAGECLPPWNSELLRTKLSSLGITNKVTLAGLLRGEDKTRILGQTDLFIFPSRAPYESFGLVLVEALMWGLPIIASDWHGNRNVLGDHFDGSLFSIDNQAAHALGTAIEQWLSGRHSSNSGFSERNRQLYLEKYSHNQDSGYNDMFFNIANYKPTR